MRRLVGPFLALLLGSALIAGCLGEGVAPERTLVDATGTAVDVSDLSRLVATSHDLVETLFLLGHGERVVGVPGWIDHPVDAKTLPRCADHPYRSPCSMGKPHVLNVEEIVAVDPSLVLLKDHPLQPTGLPDALRSVGVPVFVFDNAETVANIGYTFDTVGRILQGVDPTAPQNATVERERVEAHIDEIEETVDGSTAPHPVALYQLPVGFVAGAGTSADVLLGLAGARNLAAEAGLNGYRQISEEVIQEADPERIVAEHTAASSPEVFFQSPRYRETTAARHAPESLLIVDPATTALVGPRFDQGVREVAEWLHPVAFGLMSVDVDVSREGHDVAVIGAADAVAAPVVFRFDAGDGSPVQESATGDFAHTYATGTYTLHVFAIDAEGRAHEVRHVVEVS